jgi:hypothetical protein
MPGTEAAPKKGTAPLTPSPPSSTPFTPIASPTDTYKLRNQVTAVGYRLRT